MSYVLSEDPTYASKVRISVLLITPLSARLYIRPLNVRRVLKPQVLTVQNSPLTPSHVPLLQLKHAILHPCYCLRRCNPLRAGLQPYWSTMQASGAEFVMILSLHVQKGVDSLHTQAARVVHRRLVSMVATLSSTSVVRPTPLFTLLGAVAPIAARQLSTMVPSVFDAPIF
ncbi:hypothetical protein BC629DRAFT_1187701 [Irpex lacteus]|nr:hypothetical protein BC629DRAFT_1187701 [Irpex lacteus]